MSQESIDSRNVCLHRCRRCGCVRGLHVRGHVQVRHFVSRDTLGDEMVFHDSVIHYGHRHSEKRIYLFIRARCCSFQDQTIMRRFRPTSPFKKGKSVHFADDYSPSSIKAKIVCGPKENPTLVIRVKLTFQTGKRPTLKVKFDRPREKSPEQRHS